MYSREYTRVHVRVHACDSRATREGCQVARDRHCICICVLHLAISILMSYRHFSETPVAVPESAMAAREELVERQAIVL